MFATHVRPREINERNRQFWVEQRELLAQSVDDVTVLQPVLDVLSEEQVRGTPVYYQTSIHAVLEKFVRFRGSVVAEQGRKGGKAKKPDALQCLIEAMVQGSPEISEKELLARLRAYQPAPPIVNITDDIISFTNHDGRLKEVKVTALKDRLSRAKNKIRSRQPVGAK